MFLLMINFCKKNAKTCYCQTILLNKFFFPRVEHSQIFETTVAKTPCIAACLGNCFGKFPLCRRGATRCVEEPALWVASTSVASSVPAVGMVKKMAEME